MSYSIPVATAATKTKLRTPAHVSPFSGMCSICVDGCPGNCEIGRSAIRGTEYISPVTNDLTQTASEKDYPVDFSHFNISGSIVKSPEANLDSDNAVFPNVKLERKIGIGDEKIKLKAPFVYSALAKLNWQDYHAGAALSGVITVIGEDAVLKDPDAEFKSGRIHSSPQLKQRIDAFKQYYHGYGAIFLQANVDDEKLGVLEYAISELGLETVELKLGQGSKGIQGLGVITNLKDALSDQAKGYVIHPDPSDPKVQGRYHNGTCREFLRINRLPLWDEEALAKRVEQLRNMGAKFVSLKMGPFRPADQARVIKFVSENRIDLLTVDGAGGGTGWSPWKMMNEWGLPTVYLESLLYQFMDTINQHAPGRLPSVAIAGGFAMEDQVFKGLSLGAPYIDLIALCRAPMAAAMVGKTVGDLIKENKTPTELKQYGNSIKEIFAGIAELREIYGDEAETISPGAVGVYNYTQRIATGLRQLMSLNRKFDIAEISREDIFALTKEAASISGIKHATDFDVDEINQILKA